MAAISSVVGRLSLYSVLAKTARLRGNDVELGSRLRGNVLMSTPGRDRTCDKLIRNQLLYPTELRGQKSWPIVTSCETSSQLSLRFGFSDRIHSKPAVGRYGTKPTTSHRANWPAFQLHR